MFNQLVILDDLLIEKFNAQVFHDAAGMHLAVDELLEVAFTHLLLDLRNKALTQEL